MQDYVLAAIMPALLLAPLLGARDPRPGRGARRTLVLAFLFQTAWIFAVLFIYPRL